MFQYSFPISKKAAHLVAFFVLCLLFVSQHLIQSATFQALEHGPIHEAFISRSGQPAPLQAISSQPPAAITEKIPAQDNQQAIWINGYWAWIPEQNDFVWVSGIWRCPPPGRQWVPGVWKQFEEGWVWIQGFWSDFAESALSFIPITPPDQPDQTVDAPPSSSYFWIPGYWNYATQTSSYDWIQGHWDLLDPEWVFVPAHYVWRPEGYVFVSAYWDWPIGVCGKAFASVIIPTEQRVNVIYEPVTIVEVSTILQDNLLYYPDYLGFYQYHYHYYPEFWSDCYCTPPWWGWDTWWSFSWHDHWSVWWWYTHPGYPSPHWMNSAISSQIAPPPTKLLNLAKNFKTPSFVTPKGVITPQKLRNALGDLHGNKGKFIPVLPAKSNLLDKVKALADQKIPEGSKGLRPTGIKLKPGDALKNPPIKPAIALDQENKNLGQGKVVQLPKKPEIPTAIREQMNLKALPKISSPKDNVQISPPSVSKSMEPADLKPKVSVSPLPVSSLRPVMSATPIPSISKVPMFSPRPNIQTPIKPNLNMTPAPMHSPLTSPPSAIRRPILDRTMTTPRVLPNQGNLPKNTIQSQPILRENTSNMPQKPSINRTDNVSKDVLQVQQQRSNEIPAVNSPQANPSGSRQSIPINQPPVNQAQESVPLYQRSLKSAPPQETNQVPSQINRVNAQSNSAIQNPNASTPISTPRIIQRSYYRNEPNR